jgi:hypothetical protein
MAPRNGETTDGLDRPEPNRERGSPEPTAKFELNLDHIAGELGGIASLMDFARHCGDEKVRKVVKRWQNLGDGEKATASLDQLCQEGGITAGRFLGQMMGLLWRRNLDVATLIVSQAMPEVLQKSIERALEPAGFKDRKMFLEKLVPAVLPTNPFPATLNGEQVTTPGAGQDEDLVEVPRVEDHSVVDRIFRDLGEE